MRPFPAVPLLALLSVAGPTLACRPTPPPDEEPQEQPRGLTLLAGHAGGMGTLDGPVEEARFMGPVGLAHDAQWNLYVVDQVAAVVRKVTPKGEVTTFVGQSNRPGSADGAGTQAQLNAPTDVVVDAAGNLFIADMGNGTIRKVTPTGEVSTLAGKAGAFGTVDGVGAAARFEGPGGLALDGAGNLYVADTGAGVIRKVTPQGAVTTVAGRAGERRHVDGPASEARFVFPIDVVSDAAGNLWVTQEGPYLAELDSTTSVLRHISTDGQVSTLAGNALAAAGDVDGTGSEARFDGLQGITRDAQGNLYVVELRNNKVRKVTPQGVVTTVAGSRGNGGGSQDGTGAEAQFRVPRGVLALPVPTGTWLVVADYGNATLRQVDAGGRVRTWAGLASDFRHVDGPGHEARFWRVSAVVPDGQGGFLVTDTLHHVVRRVAADGTVSTWLGAPGEEGNVDGTGAAARFSSPMGLVRDAQGNLYVADTGNDLIRKVTPEGAVSVYAGGPLGEAGDFVDGPRLEARFFAPTALALDAEGRLYIVDAGNFAVRRVDLDGRVSTLAGDGRPGYANGRGRAARFLYPAGLAVGAGGVLYVADSMAHAIRRMEWVDGAWNVTTLAGAFPAPISGEGTPGVADGTFDAARFYAPRGLATDAEGNLYVADMGNHLLRKVTPAGVVSTVAGTPYAAGFREGPLPGTLFEPWSVAVLPDSRLVATFEAGLFEVKLP